MDRHKILLFGSAAAVRLLLFTAFPSLPPILTGRVEISTPVTSFKRLQEGLYLYTHSVPPYDGGIFHQAPLLLPLFNLLPSHPLATALLYIGLDLLNAQALITIARTAFAQKTRFFESPRKGFEYAHHSVAAAYLFNPFTIATCLARPTSVITSCAILWATANAVRARSGGFLLALGIASYLSLYPILLFPPMLLICYDVACGISPKPPPSPLQFTFTHLTGLIITIATLLYTSSLLTDSWSFLLSVYGTPLLLPDLTPNVGLWWYFFIEMFDSFREFFLAVFWLHMASYVGGLCIRLRKQPLFATVAMLGIIAIFQPYPSIADFTLFLACVPLYRHVFPLMRYTFLSIGILLYATMLGPAFYHLWIYAGSGNANFFYAITLVWSLALIIFLGDLVHAVIRDEAESERPELAGKEVRQL